MISNYKNNIGKLCLNIAPLNLGVEAIVKEVDDYKKIFEDLYKHSKNDLKYEESFAAIKSIIQVEMSKENVGDLPQFIKDIACEIFNVDFISLEKILEIDFEALHRNAKQLKKAEPIITWVTKVWIPKDKSTFFRNIFGHILRNSIEHGIEEPEIRKKNGKLASGEISFEAVYHLDRTSIYFKDDGKGLNMKALRSKNPEKNKSNSDLAELVFQSGVSTSTDITELSGRGVGMDAVREFIRNEGGDIHLELFEEDKSDCEFLSFRFVIELPHIIPKYFIKI